MVGKDLIMATLFGSGGGSSGSGGGGWPEVPDDGATYLYITLAEGRTSPMLGVGVNGTVTVDWGDSTESDVLTGTSISTTKWTPNHAYHEPGNYVIRLTVEGEMKFIGSNSRNAYANILRSTSGGDTRNRAYHCALLRVKMGNGVNNLDNGYEFSYCNALRNVVIPEGVTTIGNSAFEYCYSLATVSIPESARSIGDNAFLNCSSLTYVVFPGNVTNIGTGAFNGCGSVAVYDFTACTAVPPLGSTSAFNNIANDCEIRVPAALYDEWIAATNWATYAYRIKAY